MHLHLHLHSHIHTLTLELVIALALALAHTLTHTRPRRLYTTWLLIGTMADATFACSELLTEMTANLVSRLMFWICLLGPLGRARRGPLPFSLACLSVGRRAWSGRSQKGQLRSTRPHTCLTFDTGKKLLHLAQNGLQSNVP